jgi:poly(hydroxyalkanoate) depolymerase family esterase
MARIGKTIASLSQNRRLWAKLLAKADTHHHSAAGEPSRLREVVGFGSNPGALRMWRYAPPVLADVPALVVVLHGCTQTAAAYDHGAGWSTLADRYGFALLFPEQQAANNPKTCFNWFNPGDIARDQGEALSIRQMIERMVRDHGVDRSRIFVTGLSAGGAMANVMLATYPEVFAGGAIVAGLPYGCATSVAEAFDCMFQGRGRPAREWGDLVRAASPHEGPWPKISVWHGGADATVKPMNAGEIVKQWADVHGLAPAPTAQGTIDGYPRRAWRGPAGEDLIEEYTITGMAHGTPLATGEGDDRFGAAGPFLLEAGISSSYHIAKFWGLTGTRVAERPAAENNASAPAAAEARGIEILPPSRPTAADSEKDEIPSRRRPDSGRRGPPSVDVGAVITNALRAAGLMK